MCYTSNPFWLYRVKKSEEEVMFKAIFLGFVLIVSWTFLLMIAVGYPPYVPPGFTEVDPADVLDRPENEPNAMIIPAVYSVEPTAEDTVDSLRKEAYVEFAYGQKSGHGGDGAYFREALHMICDARGEGGEEQLAPCLAFEKDVVMSRYHFDKR